MKTAEQVLRDADIACWNSHGAIDKRVSACRDCLQQTIREALTIAHEYGVLLTTIAAVNVTGSPVEPPAEPYRVVESPPCGAMDYAVERHDGAFTSFHERGAEADSWAIRMSHAFRAGFEYARKVRIP